MHPYHCSYHLFFLSFFMVYLSICDKKGREYRHFYMTLVHILKERFYLVHICRGRNSIGEMHILKGRRHLFMRKPCFVLFYIVFVFLFSLWCFELLLVSMLYCSHRIMFMCWTCIHPLCLVLYWLHIRMIIFFLLGDHCSHFYIIVWCLIKLLIRFTSCLLYCNLLVTLYLFFITCFTLGV